MAHIHTVRLVLGDQLNAHHSWFTRPDEGVLYLMAEMRQETDYVRHHIQKVIAFFLAMRAFADERRADGHQVRYFTLDDSDNPHALPELIKLVLAETGATHFAYQLPDEYRLDNQLVCLCESLPVETSVADTEHFLTSREFLKNFFQGKKTYLMESFYRHLRKQERVLMNGEEPVGERWNFDQENRNKFPKKLSVPAAYAAKTRSVHAIVELLEASGVATIGRLDPAKFIWPVTRQEALDQLQDFMQHRLPDFGRYQDAMHTDTWSGYHSRLSFALNSKLISPLEVIQAAEQAYTDGIADIAQVEGFIRQILGWREYMRGVYWAHMPEYAQRNHFRHERPLPEWFWTGETKMNCLKHAIDQSLEHAYAHHIQRLMITGNFALLAGVHPDEVDAWYLGIYLDAIEWVEMPNTRGMALFADGGLVATKPYAASANYIHKMSNYCSGCAYNRTQKVGADACPFNSLYWHFLDRNCDSLPKNPLIGMMFSTLDKMKNRAEILAQAEAHLARLAEL